MNITTLTSTSLSDTITPVGLYLKIRDKFHNSFLLESSDYHGNENNFSFICLKPLATFTANGNIVSETIMHTEKLITVSNKKEVTTLLQNFISRHHFCGGGVVKFFFTERPFINCTVVRYG